MNRPHYPERYRTERMKWLGADQISSVAAAWRQQISWKWDAARQLVWCIGSFRNWPQVWASTLGHRPLPPVVLRSGHILYHDTRDDALSLIREIFWEHCYDHSDFYRPHRSHTVVDIGANIGIFALYLESKAPGIRIHCFEPASDTRAGLVRNVTANHLDESVTVYPFAVLNRNGNVHLNQATHSGHRSFLALENADRTSGESVACVSLHEAIRMSGAKHINLLKVDVEGVEIEIFEGADPSIWRHIDRVVVEFHDVVRVGSCERVAMILRANGFQYISIRGLPPRFTLGVIQAARDLLRAPSQTRALRYPSLP